MQISPQFEGLKNILAIRLDNIGDLVMLSPALRALRQAYPSARITLMSSPAGAQLAPLLPWVDDVITWRAVWQDISQNVPADPQKEQELVQLLAGQNFDAAFIFTSFSQSPYPPAYACYLAQIPIRVGQSAEFGGGLLTHWVKPLANTVYQADRNLHLLREVGIPVESDALELHVWPQDQRNAESLLASLGIGAHAPYIILAPGASAQARRYDEARYAEAARLIAEEAGLPIILIGSQREVGRFPTLESLAAGVSAGDEPAQDPLLRIYSLIGKTSLAEMAALIEHSTLLIGNNSGSLHMAVAFNRPMLILFSGTEVQEQWVPHSEAYTACARYLREPTGCTPCYKFQCPYQMECLDIAPEEVANAALEILRADASLTDFLTSTFTDQMER